MRNAQWKGEQRVDIRKWIPHPTKDGVSLTLHRYLLLHDSIEPVDQALRDQKDGKNVYLKRHLGGNIYVHVKSPYNGVDIRQWFIPKDCEELKPGKGIFLNPKEWEELCKVNEFYSGVTKHPQMCRSGRSYESDGMDQLC